MICFIAGLVIGAVIGVFLMSIVTMGKFADMERNINLLHQALRNADPATLAAISRVTWT